MKKDLTRIALAAGLLLLVGLVIFLINQTAQLVSLAQAIHPTFGRATLGALLLVYAGVLAVPVILFIRWPRAVTPPASDDPTQVQDFLRRLKQRLASNIHLTERRHPLETETDLEAALQVLGAKAQDLIAATAKTVFVTTAISQNGRLDGIMVLAAQSRMVWQIAHLYNQRPALREMVGLYGNIAATTFLVSELDDLNMAEQLEPLATSVLGGSVTGVVPGLGLVASLITNSLIDGAASAFLTLRVGIIARNYCGALSVLDRRATRKKATTEAASLLRSVIYDSAKKVSLAMWEAAKQAGVQVTKETGRKIINRTKTIWESTCGREAPGKTTEGSS